jgi:PAS domain S-box-containing protein
LDANRRFCRFFGVESVADFRERYGELARVVERVEAYGYLWPDGGSGWLAPLKSESGKRYRLRLKGVDGSRVFAVSLSMGTGGAEREPEGSYVLHLNDITDIEEYKLRLKASHHRLQSYMEVLDAADIVSRTTPEGIITYANDRFLEVSGYTREELLGKNHRIIRHPEMPTSLFAEMWETILKGEIWQGRVTNRRKDGSRYIVDTTIGPIFDEEGRIVEFIGIRHDVTELVQARERAEKAEMAKSLFFANLTHEIRTPLNAILGFTSLLRQRDDLPEDVRRMIGVIDESGDTLLQVVNDILDLSKFEQGHVNVDLQPMILERHLRRTVALFEAKAREKGVTLRLESDPRLRQKLLGDPHRLRQVLGNLLSNALKFTGSGGEVLLRAVPQATGDRKVSVLFEVIDSGIGIAPEAQEKIFRPFEQAEDSTQRHYGGTGLGLPICARIVEALGGELSLESREGEGSRFFFTLEFEEAEADATTLCEEEAAEEPGVNESLRFVGEVLVAEDLPFNQELIRALLQRLGVESLEIVDDGLKALERIRQHRYDLIFLDIEMPGMRGDEVLRTLRAEAPDPDIHQRIVALTAYADQEHLRAFLEMGFDDVVLKPFDEKALKAVLSRYLRTQTPAL